MTHNRTLWFGQAGFVGLGQAFLLALFCVLVIGVVYGGKATSISIPFAAEGGAPNKTKIIGVRDPTHYMETPQSPLKDERSLVADGPALKGYRHRLAACERFDQWIAHSIPVGRFHGQVPLAGDSPAPTFFTGCERATKIYHIKLAMDLAPSLKKLEERGGRGFNSFQN